MRINDFCDSDCCPLVGNIKFLEDKLKITVESNKVKISLMAELLDAMPLRDDCPFCGNYLSEGHNYNCIIRKIESYILENN